MSKASEEGTKDKLLSAAVRVFSEKGYKGATTREICKQAGAANINAIHYHFGSKEKLYRIILEKILSGQLKRQEEQTLEKNENKTPEERLEFFIFNICRILFEGDKFSEITGKIVVKEMMAPSSYFDELIQKYTVPTNKFFTQIVRDLLGEDASNELVRDCLVSIGSQIYYYHFTWPIFKRVYPDHPGMSNYFEQLAKHVTLFSLGGIEAIKKSLPPPKSKRFHKDEEQSWQSMKSCRIYWIIQKQIAVLKILERILF